MSEILLNNIRAQMDQLPRNMAYTKWFGEIFDDHNEFIRYDKSELHVLYWRKDTPVYRRLPACLVKNEAREPRLMYTTAPIARITSGIRSNRRIPKQALLPDEQWRMDGIYKKLWLGNTHNVFNKSNKMDMSFLDELEVFWDDLNNDKLVPFTVPKMCITLNKNKDEILLLRKESQAWWKQLTGLDEFDKSAVPSTLETYVGTRRTGYPFEYLFGKGVIAVDPDNAGMWSKVRVQDLNIKVPHMEISIE